MSHNLNALRGVVISGGYIGSTVGYIKGDTRRADPKP